MAGDLAFEPDTSYYFEHFDPAQKPWDPGHGLNIEEVFKNYRYYEIRFDKNRPEIAVTHHIRNSGSTRERYRVKPDGALERLEP